MASDFEGDELLLKQNVFPRRREVLEGKRLKLLDALIKYAGHGDLKLVDDLTAGFDLTGPLPESNVFAKRVKPAVMSCPELRRVAELCRQGICLKL